VPGGGPYMPEPFLGMGYLMRSDGSAPGSPGGHFLGRSQSADALFGLREFLTIFVSANLFGFRLCLHISRCDLILNIEL
jgi:hypothetical protein